VALSPLQARLAGRHRHVEAQAAEQRERFQAIERRMEAQAQEAKAAQHERINMLITGIVIGAVAVVIIVAVVLGMTGGG
jgi:uncharacterized membrane protein